MKTLWIWYANLAISPQWLPDHLAENNDLRWYTRTPGLLENIDYPLSAESYVVICSGGNMKFVSQDSTGKAVTSDKKLKFWGGSVFARATWLDYEFSKDDRRFCYEFMFREGELEAINVKLDDIKNPKCSVLRRHNNYESHNPYELDLYSYELNL